MKLPFLIGVALVNRTSSQMGLLSTCTPFLYNKGVRIKIILPVFFVSFLASSLAFSTALQAQTQILISTPRGTTVTSPLLEEGSLESKGEVELTPSPTPRPDFTAKTEESVGPLEKILEEQELGLVWASPMKYAIRSSVEAGVPANTIVLLLLMPLVAAIVAAARHLLGIRGFGIFLPASLSVVFVAIGPVLGIGLFVVIVAASTIIRFVIRKLKIKLQYLPRTAMMLLFVVLSVLGVLFAAPILNQPDLANVSIFAVLILVLLAEDFSKVQLGKSAKVAINLTTETLILSLVSFVVLTLEPIQKFALLNPEILLLSILLFDYVLGKYVGLRFREFWRFRKLIVK